MLRCRDCKSEIDLDEESASDGDIVTCLDCESQFEIRITKKVTLVPLDQDYEDDED
jgi:alpha-aminoadipate carrier protein LysW